MNVKCVVVGDGAVGKTCLLQSYVDNSFPEDYTPTVFDNTSKEVMVDNQEVSLALWDTAGQEEFDRLRPLSYPGAQVFVLCYSVDSKVSYNNIRAKWYPELNYHCPKIPIVLVGTKLDLRVGKSGNETKQMVSKSEGEKLARLIKANCFHECSARTQVNMAEVFEDAVRAGLNTSKPRSKKHNNSGRCSVV